MNRYLKLAGVLLIIYSLIAGMLIPLSTGIKDASPSIAKGGEELALQLNLYNAQLAETNYEARIRLNPDQAICAKKIEVTGPQKLTLYFDVPAGDLPIQKSGADGKKSPFPLLEMNDLKNGRSSLESVVFIQETAEKDGVKAFCEIQPYNDLSEKTTYPFLNILEETIRNLFYHVPMWFAMLFLLFLSVVYSILFLINPQTESHDIKATSLAAVGLLFGLLGTATGALWAKHTWGDYWSFDVKQNTTAVGMLIYLAYFVLRSSFDDMDKKARVSAVYNIFAFATLIPLLYVIPRMVDSLHPGGGNQGFSDLDLDNTMRMVFYPAIIGWFLIGLWIADLSSRIERLRRLKWENED